MAKMKQPAKNGVTPTSGRAWRKAREEGYIITLPSGNVAKLRPVALDVLITSGKLPDLLTPIAARTLWTEDSPQKIAEQAELAQGYAELVNVIVPAAFLSPRIVDSPQADDEISLDDLDFTDKVAVFNLCTAPAAALETFRNQQAANVDTLRNGKGDGDTAV